MLMEVLLTVAIIGLMLAPVFALQSVALRGLYRYSARLRALFPAKAFLVTALADVSDKKEDTFTEKKEITNPTATLTYNSKRVGEQSALKKQKGMVRNEVSVKVPRQKKETLVGFVYKPERKKQ